MKKKTEYTAKAKNPKSYTQLQLWADDITDATIQAQRLLNKQKFDIHELQITITQNKKPNERNNVRATNEPGQLDNKTGEK